MKSLLIIILFALLGFSIYIGVRTFTSARQVNQSTNRSFSHTNSQGLTLPNNTPSPTSGSASTTIGSSPSKPQSTPQVSPGKVSPVSQRIQNLNAVKIALDGYHAAHGYYPCSYNTGVKACKAGNQVSSGSTSWGARSECQSWGGLSPDQVIPGLAPQYIPFFPSDPEMDKVNNNACFIYESDGVDYKVIDNNVYKYTDMTLADIQAHPELTDTVYSGVVSNPCAGVNPYATTSGGATAWAIFTPGAQCW